MEPNADDVAARLLRCPVGCAFLLTIARDGIPVARAVTPPQAFARAAVARDALNPWSVDFEEAVTAALSRGAELTHLARDVAAHPASRWWTEPLDRARQALVRDDTPPPPPARQTLASRMLARVFRRVRRTPSRAAASRSNTWWEDYAQRPTAWRVTSTLSDGFSCLDTVVARGVGDWPQAELQRRFAAEIDPSARVCEINGPADWHALCVAFPSVNEDPNSPAGAGSLSPDWRRVASQWDGVHLTFLGLLTAPFVRHTTAAGTTMLWSWDTEGTIWLPGNSLRPDAPLAPVDLNPSAFTETAPLMHNDLGIPQGPPRPGIVHYRLSR